MAIYAQQAGFKGFLLPLENAPDAAIVNGLDVFAVSHLGEFVDLFKGQKKRKPLVINTRKVFAEQLKYPENDFSDVRGQERVKRCMEIAAAGGHNMILIGPPGAGKTMLAKRLPSILPPMTLREALETTKIHSVVGRSHQQGLIATRPFRSPHHTISDVALVGGG